MNESAFDKEVSALIEWCEDLDYDKYIANWHQLATSAYNKNGSADGTNRLNNPP